MMPSLPPALPRVRAWSLLALCGLAAVGALGCQARPSGTEGAAWLVTDLREKPRLQAERARRRALSATPPAEPATEPAEAALPTLPDVAMLNPAMAASLSVSQRAKALIATGRAQEALIELRQASLTAEPGERFELLLLEAQALMALGQWGEAQSRYSQLIELPDLDNAQRAEAYYGRALARVRTQALDEASADLEAAQQAQPAQAQTLDTLRVQVALAQEDPQTRAEALSALAPTQRVAAQALALQRTQEGQHEAAVVAYRQALALAPQDPQLILQLGASLMKTDQAAEAAPLLEQLTHLRPQEALGWYQLAALREAQGDRQGAQAAWRGLLRHAPDSPQAQDARRRLQDAEQ